MTAFGMRRARVLEPLDLARGRGVCRINRRRLFASVRRRIHAAHERDRNGQQCRTARTARPSSRPRPSSSAAATAATVIAQGVDDVVGRDHARPVRRLAFVLQDRVERHREETAGHRHAEEVDEQSASFRASAGRRRSSPAPRLPGGRRSPRGGPTAKKAIATAAIGTKRALTSPCRQPLGQHRSERRHRPRRAPASASRPARSAKSTSLARTGSPETTRARQTARTRTPRGSAGTAPARASRGRRRRSSRAAGAGAAHRPRRAEPAESDARPASPATATDHAEAADDERAVGERGPRCRRGWCRTGWRGMCRPR